jgi:ribA/ribD-fused uncharacterized protein
MFISAEQYMMAGKARVMGDTETLALIMQCGYEPAAIKRLGRAVEPWDEGKWVAARNGVVRRGNYLKFSQNPQLGKILRSTEGLTLVEAAGNDRIWGIGVNLGDAAAGAQWKGQNLLGEALMHVREAMGSNPAGATPDADLARQSATAKSGARSGMSLKSGKASAVRADKGKRENRLQSKFGPVAVGQPSSSTASTGSGDGSSGIAAAPPSISSTSSCGLSGSMGSLQLSSPELEVTGGSGKFDFLAVLDFEATCEDNCRHWVNEIIEFPTVVIDAATMQPVDEFQCYCKPRLNPTLTSFCTQLTGIEQRTVDQGDDFVEAFRKWSAFMERYPRSLVVTCGDWDLKVMLPLQLSQSSHSECASDLARLGTAKKLGSKWCNLKVIFGETVAKNAKKSGRLGMAGMLKKCRLELKGRHHSGIDDCRNIGQVVSHIGQQFGGGAFRVTASLSNFQVLYHSGV